MISLNHFLEMVRERYNQDKLELVLDDENIEIKDKPDTGKDRFNFIMNHFKQQDNPKKS